MEQGMMLQQVCFALSEIWMEEKRILIREFEQRGLQCREYTEAGALDDDTILVTDRESVAVEASERGIVCIGVQRGEDGFFEGAVVVTDSLAALDSDGLNEIWMRSRSVPVLIAETERLIIREIAKTDVAALCRISQMPGMDYLMSAGRNVQDFFNKESLESYITTVYRFYGYGIWSVWEKEGTLIGCCGIQDYMPEKEETDRLDNQPEYALELQYMLDPEYQRKGYGLEMCRAVLQFAFTRTEADWICVQCHPENEAGRALAGKLGFTGEGMVLWKKNIGII